MTQPDPRSRSLVLVSAGISAPSSTRLLADRLLQRAIALAAQRELVLVANVIELRELAGELAPAVVSNHLGPGLSAAIDTLAGADGVIVATPIYKAGISGLLKLFIDLLDNDLLIAKPVALAATAGTARHALVIDEQLRSLFAFMRTLTVPTSLFADTEDWASGELHSRIERAALELVLLIESGITQAIHEQSWHAYQHELGSAGGTELAIDLDSDLMRLAAGGSDGGGGGGGSAINGGSGRRPDRHPASPAPHRATPAAR